MKRAEIKQGRVYEGATGLRRRVVSMDGEVVTYKRVLTPTERAGGSSRGSVAGKMSLRRFADWAAREVMS